MSQSIWSLFFWILAASIASITLLSWLIPSLRRQLIDLPNSRSSHSYPIPTGGGLVFVFLSVVSVVIAFFSPFPLLVVSSVGQFGVLLLPLLVLPLALVGLFDDRYHLPVGFRYGFQLITALLIIMFSPLTSNLLLSTYSDLPFSFIPAILSSVFILFAITAVINFTNFMDGLDGLVAGCMSVAFTTLAIHLSAPWPAYFLVGSLLGFLFFNWNPAKVFMGDVGSTFLGAVFAGLVLQASSWSQALSLLLTATPLLGDAFICVIRRFLSGQRVFEAHRQHLFQRLYLAGWSQSRISSIYILATFILSLSLFVASLPLILSLSVLILLLGLWLDMRFAAPFASVSEG